MKLPALLLQIVNQGEKGRGKGWFQTLPAGCAPQCSSPVFSHPATGFDGHLQGSFGRPVFQIGQRALEEQSTQFQQFCLIAVKAKAQLYDPGVIGYDVV